MKDSLRSVYAAAGISACCMCLLWGSSERDRIDVGNSNALASNSNPMLGALVASRDNQMNVPASDYYSQMVSLLKQYYVEPIKDDDKLANGAVRGMIASLGDAQSMYMDAPEFQAYLNREKGIYEGIGADIVLEQHGKKAIMPGSQVPPEDAEEAVATMSRFPSAVVAAVVPGGPADKAGVQVGDVVSEVDGHWVVEDSALEKFKKARDAFAANKMSFTEIEGLRKQLQEKTERALLPGKTLAKLMVGKSGDIDITWSRAGVERKTKITKEASKMPDFSAGETIVLPMTLEAAKALKPAIAGHPTVTIDLRQDAEGDYSAMLGCLDVLAPTGKYGEIVNQRSEEPTLVSVASGNPNPPKINFLVSRSTRGPAAILALALSSRGRATLTGQLTMGRHTVKQDVELPTGTGYDLVTGDYRTSIDKPSPAKGKAVVALGSTTKHLDTSIGKGAYANADRSMLKHENEQNSGGVN